MGAPARWIDLAVIVIYLAGITWFGSAISLVTTHLAGLFPGWQNRAMVAIALSIVVGGDQHAHRDRDPSLAFRGNFAFLQLVLGYLLGRLVVATFFLPAYFRGEMYTAYELMRVRFWRTHPAFDGGSLSGAAGASRRRARIRRFHRDFHHPGCRRDGFYRGHPVSDPVLHV